MQNTEYARASILHYDVRPLVRKRTTAALRQLGFRRIANVERPRDLSQIVKQRQFELAVFAADANDDGTAKLVRRARRYNTSSDPFTPMTLVSWNSASDMVQKALNTGTDQILMWPFTTEQLGARVEALINARKPFVETESYLGPDRRDPLRLARADRSVEVPNALRARVQGCPDLAPSPDAIEVARISLERIKITNVARRICVVAKVLRQKRGDGDYMAAKAGPELAAIANSLAVIRRSLVVTQLDYMYSFCDSVEQVLEQLFKSVPDLHGRGLALLEQTALALRVAMDVDEDTAMAAFRLSDEVSRAV
jgi:DNA-binding response OmpR family regulator